jgi:hypothetical protein
MYIHMLERGGTGGPASLLRPANFGHHDLKAMMVVGKTKCLAKTWDCAITLGFLHRLPMPDTLQACDVSMWSTGELQAP